jgi:diacylglycerol kinase
MFRLRLNSFKVAFSGLFILFKTQHHARFHLAAAILVVLVAVVLKASLTEWCILILAICMVMSAEGFNSAIEEIVNFISPDYHKTAGKIKDLAAGAVLISVLGAILAGLLIFLPKIISLVDSWA